MMHVLLPILKPTMSSLKPAIIAVLGLLAARLPADVSDVVSSRALASVRSKGQLTRSASSTADLRYLPSLACHDAVLAGVNAISPTVIVELLAWTRTEGARLDAPAGRLAVYNALRSMSRLEGLEYYSASHHAMRLLYRTSHRIVSPTDRSRLPDPLVSFPPSTDSIWVYQDDTTFGGNVFRVDYENAERYVLMRVANQNVMRFLLIPLVQAGGTVLYFVIVPDGEEILFYAVAAARLSGPLARVGAVQESFSNRVEAMYRWFKSALGAG